MTKHLNQGYINHANTSNYSHNDIAKVPHINTYDNSSFSDHYSQSNTYSKSVEEYVEYNKHSDVIPYSDYYSQDRVILSKNIKPRAHSQYNEESYEYSCYFCAHTDTTSGKPGDYYKNTIADSYSQSNQYSQNPGTYSQKAEIPHQNTVLSQHTNTGYTDHLNTNTNTQPSNVSGFKPNSAVYYKTTVNLTWNKATDDKCISVISSSYGDKNAGSVGIYEYNTKKVTLGRGISIGCWNADGNWNSGMTKDTYTDAGLINTIKSHIDSLANGSYIAIGTWDAILQTDDLSAFKTFLTGYGFKSHTVLEGARSCFAGIFKKGSGVLSEQSHRYGITPTTPGSVSAQHTIAGLGNQTITYVIQYAFKPVGGAYGAWTNAGTTTSLSFSYSLASHGSGYIKFRVIANDGMENSPQYVESSELRILKYNAPSWKNNISAGENITAAAVNEVTVEINNISTGLGLGTSSLRFNAGDVVKITQIQELRQKINAIATVTKKTALSDSNTGILYATDINNIKKFINEI